MGSIAWEMTPEIAMEFFKRCSEQGADTEQERAAILKRFADEGKLIRVTATKRSKEKFIKDRAKHFKILHIGKSKK